MPTILRLPGAAPSPISARQAPPLARQSSELEPIPKLRGIRTQYWHFVKLARSLTHREREVLDALLTYGPEVAHGRSARGHPAWSCRGWAPSRHGRPKRPTSRTHAGWTRWSASSAARRFASSWPRVARAGRTGAARAAAADPRPHDRNGARARWRQADALFHHAEPAAARCRSICSAAVCRRSKQANRSMGLALSQDEIAYLRRLLRPHPAQSHRCRADDVRAGQLRALPAQDLQCRLGDRRGGACPSRCFGMIKHTHARASGGHAGRVCGQRRGHARAPESRGFYPDARRRVSPQRRVHAHPDEGRDAQPSDRDLAVSRRRDRLGRRDPRRGCDRAGRQAQGGTHRLHRLASAHPGVLCSLGRASDYGRPGRIASPLQIMLEGPIGARQLQQRVRPAQPAGLLPHLRAAGGRRAARLSQADHDRRRRRQHRPDRRSTSGRSPPARRWCSSAGPGC